MTAVTPQLRYELVHCSNPDCDHVYVRPPGRQLTLPCVHCHSEMTIATGRLVLDDERPFDAYDMREALTAALDTCEQLLSYELAGWSEGKRRQMQGRRDAYREALEMLDRLPAEASA